MKRKIVTRLLSGMTTAVVTVSSLAAPVMAAPEDEGFGDYLEEAFEGEAEEVIEEDFTEIEEESDASIEEEYEETELLFDVAPTSISGVPSGNVVVSPYGADYDITNACVLPSGANQTLNWSSSNTDLVSVWRPTTHANAREQKLFPNRDGRTGTATITVTTADGTKTATFRVVVQSVAAETITSYLGSDTVYLMPGMSLNDLALITPTDCTTAHKDYQDYSNTLINATSSKSSVVAIENKGCWGPDSSGTNFRYAFGLTGVLPGSSTITYKLREGSYASAKTEVVVLPADTPTYDMESNEITFRVGDSGTEYGTVNGNSWQHKGQPYKVYGDLNPAFEGLYVASSDVHAVSGSWENGCLCIYPGDVGGTATLTLYGRYNNSDIDDLYPQQVTVNVLSPAVAATGVSLDKTSATLGKGATLSLTATVSPENSTDEVTWKSSNTNVATVDETGKVVAVADGSATITATAGSKSATCSVSVKTPVTNITLDKEDFAITAGESVKIGAAITPEDATNTKLTFSSSNTSVATVSSDGTVKALTPGETTITVTSNNDSAFENVSKSVKVTVNAAPVAVSSVTLNKTSLTLTAGETSELSATVNPSNATDKSISWASNDTSVVTVDETGIVTAKAPGTATITVTTADGNKTANCLVTVTAATVPVNGVELSTTTGSLVVGESATLTATISPANASNKEVSFATDNADVATVDANGKVTAVGAGVAIITVTTKDGSKTATCKVTVSAAVVDVDVTGVALDRTSASMAINDTITLVATVSPENATNKAVSWSSSNTDVATVNENGVVTAKAAGESTITVTTADGEKTATCKVTVSAAVVEVTGVSLSQKTVTLKIDETTKLAAVVSPSDASYQSITWKSDDPAVANVGSDGTVTAISAGSTKIRGYVVEADGRDWLYSASCDVTVLADKVEEVSKKIEELPDPAEVKPEDEDVIKQVKALIESLTPEERAEIDPEILKRLDAIVAALEEAKGGEEVEGQTFKYNETTEEFDYYVDGHIDYDFYGFVDYEGFKFIVANGKIARVNGLVMDPNSDLWYFCAEGQVVQHTGLVMYNEEWFYVKDGVLDTNLNALVPYNGGLFYVAAGRITREVSGLVLDPNGSGWYFVALGEVQNQYTGLATYNGAWFYVIKGKLAEDYTGVVTYDGQLFNVVNGMVY